MPDGVLRTESGAAISLRELRAGKPSVLVFWVPGGKFTQSSVGPVIELARERSDELTVIPIAAATDSERLEGFLGRYPAFRGSYLDPDRSVARAFKVQGVPAVFLASSDGTIIFGSVGPTPGLLQTTRDRIDRILRLQDSRKESSSEGADQEPTGSQAAPEVEETG